jgi:putative phage-type endonuclease
MDQRTPEWFATRCGKATASRIADIIAKTKSGYGASRANYAAQLVAERLTGTVEEGFTNAAMLWGIEKEADARSIYCFREDVDVEEVGFIDHPSIAWSGASPDGLIGDVGMLEIKCPNTATHIDTLLSGEIPAKYQTQMLWQIACSGREWCDFVSYDPRLPEKMRLFVKRFHLDRERLEQVETDVAGFLAEVRITVERLREAYDPLPADAARVGDILMAG